jgi:hypothetical protein
VESKWRCTRVARGGEHGGVNATGVELVEVVHAELAVGLASRENVVDHEQQAVCDGNGGLLAPRSSAYQHSAC